MGFAARTVFRMRGRLVARGRTFCVWIKSGNERINTDYYFSARLDLLGNFAGSLRKNTGVLLKTQSMFP